MPYPLVSIIVLNWNGERHIHRCVEHVVAQSYEPIEVIFIDNGSTDGSLQKVMAKYPHFIFLRNEVNRGYAAGMNQGIARARGEYIIPLGQDVCLHREFVAECVRRMEADPSIGAVGGRVFRWVGDTLTDELRKGEGDQNLFRKRFQGLGGVRAETDTWTFAPPSFPFLRRRMLEDLQSVSGHCYDEAFESYWEDTDLFFRMQLRGWKCLFSPAACGWHVGSGSVGGNARLISKALPYQAKALRNRYFTMLKNLPLNMMLWLTPYLVVTELSLLPYFLVRSPKSILALLSAWKQLIRSFPEVMRKRKRIQDSMTVGPDHLKQYFVRF